MSFAFHGNWCGPGWTAGQRKNANELTDADKDVPAVDELDAACKVHDIDISLAKDDQDLKDANEKFTASTKGLGLKAGLAAWLVSNFGPTKKGIIIHFESRCQNRLKMKNGL